MKNKKSLIWVLSILLCFGNLGFSVAAEETSVSEENVQDTVIAEEHSEEEAEAAEEKNESESFGEEEAVTEISETDGENEDSTASVSGEDSDENVTEAIDEQHPKAITEDTDNEESRIDNAETITSDGITEDTSDDLLNNEDNHTDNMLLESENVKSEEEKSVFIESESESDEKEQFLYEITGNYRYTVNDDGTITITGYDGDETELDIPSELDGHKVTGIGHEAFYNYAKLLSITIPAGVSSIGNRAFGNCTELTTIIIPSSLTGIGRDAFDNCISLKTAGPLDSDSNIRIEFVSELNDVYSGYNNYSWGDGGLFSNITEITIPDVVTSIGDHAFNYCENLKSVHIPETVKSIGKSAFSNCDSLTDILIPGSVVSIGESAFYDCDSLAKVNIESGLKTIGSGAFMNCKSLSEIVIPESVSMLANGFYGCSNLKTAGPIGSDANIQIDFGNTVKNIYAGKVGDVYYGNGFLFYYLEGIEIPYGVKTIESNAFFNCDHLVKVLLPNGLCHINEYAFYACDYLTHIDIPVGITEIDSRAFANCGGLVSIDLPDTLTSIGEYAFENCKNLGSISLPSKVKTIGNHAFKDCSSLKNIVLPLGIDKIEFSAFSGCTSLEEIALPNSLSDIGNSLFYGCTSLSKVVLPNSITKLSQTFLGCTNLESIEIPNSIVDIGHETFKDCSNLKYISVPDTVTNIGISAFENCTSLSSISLPDGIKYIQNKTFSGCTSLKEVRVPSSLYIYEKAFENCTSLEKLNYGYIYAIGEGAFEDCTNLKEVGLICTNTIGAYAFHNCRNLRKLEINVSLQTVSTGAFRDASGNITVHYYGSEDQFNKVTINDYNAPLLSAEKVFYPVITGLQLKEKNITMQVGETRKLNVVLTPSNANAKSLRWESYSDYLRVYSNGNVTALKNGNGMVNVSYPSSNGYYIGASCNVTVTSVPVTGVTIKTPKTTIKKGETITLSAVVQPAGSSDPTISWSSSDTSVAFVDRNGNVTGMGGGKAVITAVSGNGKKSTVTITVQSPVTGFEITESSIDLAVNNSYTLNYRIIPGDANNQKITWSSNKKSVATVKNGVVTAVGKGKAVITGKTADGGYSAQVTVSTYVEPLKGFAFESDTFTVAIGETKAMPAVWTPANASNKNAKWTSDNPDAITVDSIGNVTGVSLGTAKIRAVTEEGNYAAECTVKTVFSDVADPNEFYYEYVYNMVDKGIVTGWADGTFRPYNECNRAAVVTFLWRLEGRPEPKKKAGFSDLTGNPEFDKAIAWASENGITTGWSDNTFRPWNSCNRAAVMTFLWRAAGKPKPNKKASFSDLTGNTDFDDAISWASENGITTGWADGTFRPWNICNRLAVVSFLSRYEALR